MRKYRVRWDYVGRDWRGGEIRLKKDDVVTLDEATATWLLADNPGMLDELGKPVQARLMDEPGQDRMLRQAKNR